MAILVLITMQKLASSSVAAVRHALAKRLARLQDAREKMDQAAKELERIEQLKAEDDPANLDEITRCEEQVVESLGTVVRLNPNEIPALEELLTVADEVEVETKITRILEVVEESFSEQSVLFFTEYKATQAMLMSALQMRYGDGCVAFINGDGRVEGVKNLKGDVSTLNEDRGRAAKRFNSGDVRFLVSTEAAGEGIDLQANCSALIHVDLPWNIRGGCGQRVIPDMGRRVSSRSRFSTHSKRMRMKSTVFVVDDDPGMRHSLEMLLSVLDFDVRCFASAADFDAFYRREIPGCLVLDVRMPVEDGLQLYERLLREGNACL